MWVKPTDKEVNCLDMKWCGSRFERVNSILCGKHTTTYNIDTAYQVQK